MSGSDACLRDASENGVAFQAGPERGNLRPTGLVLQRVVALERFWSDGSYGRGVTDQKEEQ